MASNGLIFYRRTPKVLSNGKITARTVNQSIGMTDFFKISNILSLTFMKESNMG